MVNLNVKGVVNKSIKLLISFIIWAIVILNDEQCIFRPCKTGSGEVFIDPLKRLAPKGCIETAW